MAAITLGKLASKARLTKLLDVIRTSFWVVPALMILAAGALSMVLLRLDGAGALDHLVQSGLLYGGGPQGARQILATIAGSMITIAGVVFSITVVVLTLASSQFGSRLLRQFMDDRGNQFVLGTFTATFLFCILGMRVVDATREEPYVPHLTVTVGVVLAIASLGVLIYFIHHMAASIQAPRVVERAGQEMDRVVERVVVKPRREEGPADHRMAEPDPDAVLPDGFHRDSFPVSAEGRGYVQAVDVERLVEVAESRGLVVRVVRDVGHYVMEGTTLARGWPREAVDPDAVEAIAESFITGHRRTPLQDLVHALGQITEVAVRALSPGINDPFTARTCVFRSAVGLARVLEWGEPPWLAQDGDGHLRVVRPPLTLDDLLRATWDPVRRHARGSVIVLQALLDAVEELAPRARAEVHRRALRRQVDLVLEQARRTVPLAGDREGLEARGAALDRMWRGDAGVPAEVGR